jgi:type VI secretion system protein ImpL
LSPPCSRTTFQFKPIFRGFTSPRQSRGNDIKPAINDRILRKFSLQGGGNGQVRAALSHGYFLKELFSKVIFPDRNLVRQHTTRAKTRLRQFAVLGALCCLGLALGGWSWSYFNNRSLLANVEQDLAKAVKLQEGRIDLQSRLEAWKSFRIVWRSSNSSMLSIRCPSAWASTRGSGWLTACAVSISPA